MSSCLVIIILLLFSIFVKDYLLLSAIHCLFSVSHKMQCEGQSLLLFVISEICHAEQYLKTQIYIYIHIYMFSLGLQSAKIQTTELS